MSQFSWEVSQSLDRDADLDAARGLVARLLDAVAPGEYVKVQLERLRSLVSPARAKEQISASRLSDIFYRKARRIERWEWRRLLAAHAASMRLRADRARAELSAVESDLATLTDDGVER